MQMQMYHGKMQVKFEYGWSPFIFAGVNAHGLIKIYLPILCCWRGHLCHTDTSSSLLICLFLFFQSICLLVCLSVCFALASIIHICYIKVLLVLYYISQIHQIFTCQSLNPSLSLSFSLSLFLYSFINLSF